jgi:hypothetical protein
MLVFASSKQVEGRPSLRNILSRTGGGGRGGSVTTKNVRFGLVAGCICLLQPSVTTPVSGATATHHSSQFTVHSSLWHFFGCFWNPWNWRLELTHGVSLSLSLSRTLLASLSNCPSLSFSQTKNQTPWPLVRERSIPTERPPLFDEI